MKIFIVLILIITAVNAAVIPFHVTGRSSGKRSVGRRTGPRKVSVLHDEYIFTKPWYPYIYVDLINRYVRYYPDSIKECNSTDIDESLECFWIYDYYFDITNCTSAVYNIVSQGDKCLPGCNSTYIDKTFSDYGISKNESLFSHCNITFNEIIDSINNSEIQSISLSIGMISIFLTLFLI